MVNKPIKKICLTSLVISEMQIKTTTRYHFTSSQITKSGNKVNKALAGVVQWIENGPENQRVAGSIPNHGTYLGWKPGPQ